MAKIIMPTTLIQKLEDDSIVSHFNEGSPMSFSKGDNIIQSDEEPQGVYLVKSGFVKAYSISRDGHNNLLLVHKSGEFIPLPWALNGEHNTGLSYEAMSDVTVLRVSKDRLRATMGNNSWLSREILNQAVGIISIYTQRIQILEYRSARERVIAELVYLSRRFGKKKRDKTVIDAPITHQDIADSINMSRETASRALELLFNEKLLSQDGHLFVINDVLELQALLD